MSIGKEAGCSRAVGEIAQALFRSECLKFGGFRIKSGPESPYYIDLSWLLSSPKDFCCARDAVASEVKRIVALGRVDKLASIELKGALILPSVASKLNLPCVVVRKEEKKHGFVGRIAGGTVTKGENLLFFDDVISDGGSKLAGIEPLRKLGAYIENVLVVVDREQGGKENLQHHGLKLHALATVSQLITCLLQSASIPEGQAKAMLDYVEGWRRR